jgi:hypothetical protein
LQYSFSPQPSSPSNQSGFGASIPICVHSQLTPHDQ